MDISVINSTLYKDAKNLGACDKVMGKWQGLYSIDDLMALFNHNQEFCIQHQFPNNEFLKTVSSVAERNKNGMFVDDKVSVHNFDGLMTILGDSSGYVLCDSFNALTVYVRHNADITFSCKGFSRVFIKVHDNCKVHIEQSDMSKVYVYKYGENAKISYDGDIIFRQK